MISAAFAAKQVIVVLEMTEDLQLIHLWEKAVVHCATEEMVGDLQHLVTFVKIGYWELVATKPWEADFAAEEKFVVDEMDIVNVVDLEVAAGHMDIEVVASS